MRSRTWTCGPDAPLCLFLHWRRSRFQSPHPAREERSRLPPPPPPGAPAHWRPADSLNPWARGRSPPSQHPGQPLPSGKDRREPRDPYLLMGRVEATGSSYRAHLPTLEPRLKRTARSKCFSNPPGGEEGYKGQGTGPVEYGTRRRGRGAVLLVSGPARRLRLGAGITHVDFTSAGTPRTRGQLGKGPGQGREPGTRTGEGRKPSPALEMSTQQSRNRLPWQAPVRPARAAKSSRGPWQPAQFPTTDTFPALLLPFPTVLPPFCKLRQSSEYQPCVHPPIPTLQRGAARRMR